MFEFENYSLNQLRLSPNVLELLTHNDEAPSGGDIATNVEPRWDVFLSYVKDFVGRTP